MAAVVIVACAAPAAAAGTVCRSVGIAGFEAQQRSARRVLAAATTRTDALELYVEKVAGGYYYESNFVAGGAAYTTKIFSVEAMPLLSVVENLLYSTRAEADRHPGVAAEIVARYLIVHAAPSTGVPT